MRDHSEACLVENKEGNARWLVVRSKPRKERIALLHLAQRQVEPYCPMFLEPPWHPRAPRGPMPLFPGYLFVQCKPLVELNAVQYCPGVMHVLSFDRRLAAVDQEFIDELRAREAERGYVIPPEMADGIDRNSRVRVMAGPMKGMEGIFRGYLRGRDRARVLTEFLRRKTLVEVDTTSLAVVRR